MQIELFATNNPEHKTDKKKWARDVPTMAYIEMELEGKSKLESFWFVMDANFETDAKKLYNSFEDNGIITFVDFNLFGVNYRVEELFGSVTFNTVKFCELGEEYTYNKKLINKIKEELRRFVFKNIHQIIRD